MRFIFFIIEQVKGVNLELRDNILIIGIVIGEGKEIMENLVLFVFLFLEEKGWVYIKIIYLYFFVFLKRFFRNYL